MKILATGMGWIEHTPGGLNRYFADYLQAMQERGHEVAGFMTANGAAPATPGYIREVLPKAGKAGTLSRIRYFRENVKREAAADTPDVFNPHFGLYASLVTRGLLPEGTPVVTHFHGPWAAESQVEDRGQTLGRKLRYQVKKNIELLAYRRSDRFIVLSRYFHDVLTRDYGIDSKRIHIIPGAVNTRIFRPAADREALRQTLGLAGEQKVFFSARRLVKRMGIDRLIRAMAPVVAQHPEAVLYIAGGGSMKEELDQLIADLNLRGNVVLLGRVPNEELVHWYQAADYSIVPTVTLEGFGLVTVEALACGTPVIGTPYGGTKEILGNFQEDLLFQDSTPKAMTEKLLDILSGVCPVPARDACREHVLQRYTWEKVVDSVAEVFREAVEERRMVQGVQINGGLVQPRK